MTHSTFGAPAVKTCTKCGQVKPLSEFYFHKSGRKAGKPWGFCKECDQARGRKYREAYPERFAEVHRAYRARNRDRMRARYYESAKDPEFRAKRAAWTRRWRQEKRKSFQVSNKLAYYAVRNAVRRGDFPPATTMVCEVCQEAQAKQWHHHKGYAPENFLDVAALCVDCHGKVHRVQS